LRKLRRCAILLKEMDNLDIGKVPDIGEESLNVEGEYSPDCGGCA
jgi:hypothetical protein